MKEASARVVRFSEPLNSKRVDLPASRLILVLLFKALFILPYPTFFIDNHRLMGCQQLALLRRYAANVSRLFSRISHVPREKPCLPHPRLLTTEHDSV